MQRISEHLCQDQIVARQAQVLVAIDTAPRSEIIDHLI